MSKKDYTQFGDEIVRLVGGRDNVTDLVHCVTRLRFTLKDDSKADEAALKKLDGVLGIVNANNQYQVVVGGEVIPAYNAIQEKYHFGENAKEIEAKPVEKKKGWKGFWSFLLDYLSGTMVQIIPLFIGCGLMSVILSVSQVFFNVDKSSSTYLVLNSVANCVFYFLPVFAGFAAGRKLKCNPFICALFCLFLLHPNFLSMVGGDTETTLFGLPFQALNYSSTIFPALIGVWVYSRLESKIYGFLPNVLKSVFGPFLSILVMSFLMLYLIGPAGYYLGRGLANMVLALSKVPYGIGCGLVSAFQPVLVMFGAHTVLAPVMIEAISTIGYDNLVRPAFIMASFAGFGAVLCVAIRAKDPKFKSVAATAAVTQFLGTAEPAMYAVYLPLVKPFAALMAGAFCGGVVSSLTGARAYAMGKNGVFGWLVFQDTMPQIILASSVAAAVSFALTWILGFDESKVTQG